MLYDRHLAYDSNVQNFADTSRIWRSIFSSSSSYHTHRPHHQNDVHFTYCYYWNYIRYIILEAHLFLEMSWSITMNTHMNARHKKSETQSSLIGLEAMPKLLFFGEMVELWPRKTSHIVRAYDDDRANNDHLLHLFLFPKSILLFMTATLSALSMEDVRLQTNFCIHHFHRKFNIGSCQKFIKQYRFY